MDETAHVMTWRLRRNMWVDSRTDESSSLSDAIENSD